MTESFTPDPGGLRERVQEAMGDRLLREAPGYDPGQVIPVVLVPPADGVIRVEVVNPTPSPAPVPQWIGPLEKTFPVATNPAIEIELPPSRIFVVYWLLSAGVSQSKTLQMRTHPPPGGGGSDLVVRDVDFDSTENLGYTLMNASQQAYVGSVLRFQINGSAVAPAPTIGVWLMAL